MIDVVLLESLWDACTSNMYVQVTCMYLLKVPVCNSYNVDANTCNHYFEQKSATTTAMLILCYSSKCFLVYLGSIFCLSLLTPPL